MLSMEDLCLRYFVLKLLIKLQRTGPFATAILSDNLSTLHLLIDESFLVGNILERRQSERIEKYVMVNHNEALSIQQVAALPPSHGPPLLFIADLSSSDQARYTYFQWDPSFQNLFASNSSLCAPSSLKHFCSQCISAPAHCRA